MSLMPIYDGERGISMVNLPAAKGKATYPDREQRIGARPRLRCLLRVPRQEVVHLVREREHSRLVRRDEVCINCRAAVSEVVPGLMPPRQRV